MAAIFRSIGPPIRHDVPIQRAFFVLGGEKLVAVAGGAARIWETATRTPVGNPIPAPSLVGLGLGPDGKTLSVRTAARVVQLYDMATGEAIGRPLAHPKVIAGCVLSPDGAVVALSTQDGGVQLFDPRTGRPRGEPLWRDLTVPATRMAFSPDSQSLLVQCKEYDEPVRLWDVATGQPRGQPIPLGGRFDGACFHPDSSTFVTSVLRQDSSRPISEGRLWDTSSGRPVGTLFAYPSRGWGAVVMVFSHDGRTILIQEAQGVVRLWDCATRRPLGPAIAQSSVIRSVAVHPDGKTVLTGGDDSVARLWSVDSGRLLGELPFDTPGWTDYVAFSPDGRTFLAATFDRIAWARAPEEGARPPAGAARLWDTATRLPLGYPFTGRG
jgi:WD40 repeat protein